MARKAVVGQASSVVEAFCWPFNKVPRFGGVVGWIMDGRPLRDVDMFNGPSLGINETGDHGCSPTKTKMDSIIPKIPLR